MHLNLNLCLYQCMGPVYVSVAQRFECDKAMKGDTTADIRRLAPLQRLTLLSIATVSIATLEPMVLLCDTAPFFSCAISCTQSFMF